MNCPIEAIALDEFGLELARITFSDIWIALHTARKMSQQPDCFAAYITGAPRQLFCYKEGVLVNIGLP